MPRAPRILVEGGLCYVFNRFAQGEGASLILTGRSISSSCTETSSSGTNSWCLLGACCQTTSTSRGCRPDSRALPWCSDTGGGR